MHAKLQKLVYACMVVCNLGVCMLALEHMQHMRDAHHELALGLPRYKCDTVYIATDTVAIGNEMQLFAAN